MPALFEVFWVYAKEAEKIVAPLGQRLKTVSGDVRSLAFLKQRISVAVQRGNAAAILGTLSHGKVEFELRSEGRLCLFWSSSLIFPSYA